MKIALLGTGFGLAHAAVYAQRPDVDEVIVFGRTPQKLATISGQFGFATTTDLDGLITDASVDLVDICLPTRLHAEVTVAAMQAGRDVFIELLGQPDIVHVAGTGRPGAPGSAAEVILGYSNAIVRCASSSLMPQPHGVRGGWRATFTSAVLEYTMCAGYTGQGPATLTEHTADGEQAIVLPDASPPCAAMIDHVLACLTGRASNLIEPASAPALELTLDVQSRLTSQ